MASGVGVGIQVSPTGQALWLLPAHTVTTFAPPQPHNPVGLQNTCKQSNLLHISTKNATLIHNRASPLPPLPHTPSPEIDSSPRQAVEALSLRQRVAVLGRQQARTPLLPPFPIFT